jgi:acetylornithine deacetylase/succinyl-diaminopimelate desuccinylase-like protein
MNTKNLKKSIEEAWEQSIIPTLSRYIEIPCTSPAFDPNWEKNGYIDQAMDLLVDWCQAQAIPDMQLQVHRLPGRTPLLRIEIPGEAEGTVLLYGHMDKQPEMTGWRAELGPWKPVIQEGRLYGRGAADDGYAVCAALTAIRALKIQGLPHARCVILIEASEESGSVDLPAYISHLAAQIGKPDLIVCLDSGCDNYDQLWCTSSLRGLIRAQLCVEILTEGVHSGLASGIVPSSFRILRSLLDRIEDPHTGEILLPALQVDIPAQRKMEAKKTAEVLHDAVWKNYPWVEGAHPSALPAEEYILCRNWKPALCVTGMDDIPSMQAGGNVLRPKTSAMLSLRIPPTCDPQQAALALKAALQRDPPYGAHISVKTSYDTGWNAPALQPWLAEALDQASLQHFGKPVMHRGEGGSIPFMYLLGAQFPDAQCLVTGVLGPHSNAHGPNEFLHIETAKKVTACVAEVLAAQAAAFSQKPVN